jgi:hypothetical protein
LPENKLKNPYQIAFFSPSMSATLLSRMCQEYHAKKDLLTLERFAKLVGWEVVKSADLNWRQRQKYKDHKFRVGYYIYYILPRSEIDNAAVI